MIRLALLFVVGLAALGVCIFGAIVEWPAFLRSWLAATLFWGVVPLTGIAVLMVHGLTGGAWGEHSRPVWRALAATMPLFVLAMVPLLFGLDELFVWTQPKEELPEVVQHKLLYLNVPFFQARSGLYFVVWLALAGLLGAWHERRARIVYGPGLVLWVFTISFFSIDWIMSLEPKFYSDVFGLIIATGAASAGFAFGLLLSVRDAGESVRLDLANIWLTLLLGWAFMCFAQMIIIWQGNIPHEIEWYVHRHRDLWRLLVWIAFVLFLALPFGVLLSTAAKRRAGWLIAAALTCLCGHVAYVYWLIMPSYESWLPAQYWLGPAALIGLGAAFIAMAQWRLA
ncbi:MAG: hypothetical protein L0H63_16485, partial [Nitrococcus sp.]|nr:hypothetical protein [Nitrococcus sp.]